MEGRTQKALLTQLRNYRRGKRKRGGSAEESRSRAAVSAVAETFINRVGSRGGRYACGRERESFISRYESIKIVVSLKKAYLGYQQKTGKGKTEVDPKRPLKIGTS